MNRLTTALRPLAAHALRLVDELPWRRADRRLQLVRRVWRTVSLDRLPQRARG